MKRNLLFGVLGACAIFSTNLQAQRYYDEVFTNDQVVVHSNVTFATNVDFLTSDLSDPPSVGADAMTLQTAVALGNPIPAEFYNPLDESTVLKVTDLKMDIYEPNQDDDLFDSRPVIVYVHTGNFLPPPINGSPNGTKTDSAAVELCRQWARRGYVAISVDYRLGWRPDLPLVQQRRGTLLNAVYRAIHDVKEGVRFLRGDAMALNTYAIDESKIVLYGQGSGGYVSQAYTTLDNPSVELFLEKFRPDPFVEDVSYIDQATVGNIEGFNGALTLYQDEGISSEVHMSINAGGALADESWLEAGDVPMCSISCIRDDFAPFNVGTVIVPTTQEEVVPVHGPNFFIQKANDLGNNDVFAMLPAGDPYTDRARSLYGQTFDVSLGNQITVASTPEGLFPIELPLTSYLTNQASPWEWWNPNSPIAQTEVAPGVTANMASLSSNPDMSPEKGRTYLDTIQGYILPRIMCTLDLPGNLCASVGPDNDECGNAEDLNLLFGTDLGVTQLSDPYSNVGAGISNDPSEGWDCFGEPDGSADSPELNNSIWFSFEGDGAEYSILTNDCNNTLGEDYIDFGDTQIAVYTGDCGALVPVVCNEDSDDAVVDDYFAEAIVATEPGTTYYVLIDGYSDAGDVAEGSFCIAVTQTAVGVLELDNVKFDLYPNPANGSFTVSADERILDITIYSLMGRMVENHSQLSTNMKIVNTANLSQGVYMVNVTLESGTQTTRLIVE